MNAKYPTWAERGTAALTESRKPKPAKAPKAPTRAELIERLREEVVAAIGLTAERRHRMILLLDAIASAKR